LQFQKYIKNSIYSHFLTLNDKNYHFLPVDNPLNAEISFLFHLNANYFHCHISSHSPHHPHRPPPAVENFSQKNFPAVGDSIADTNHQPTVDGDQIADDFFCKKTRFFAKNACFAIA